MNDFKQQLAPGWSGVNIAIIIILLVLGAWPFALIMVAYILWGQKLGLDLSQPGSIGVFSKRIAHAWRAALQAFKNPS